MSDDEQVSERVRQTIKAKRRNVDAVANLCGMSGATLRARLRGARPWRYGEVVAIAHELRVAPVVLLGQAS